MWPYGSGDESLNDVVISPTEMEIGQVYRYRFNIAKLLIVKRENGHIYIGLAEPYEEPTKNG